MLHTIIIPQMDGPITNRIGYLDYSYVINHDSKTIVRYDETHHRSDKNGLLHRTVPFTDAAELGFVTQIGEWMLAVRKHYASDQMAIQSAAELALKVINLQESIPNLQVEFMWPGHVYANGNWRCVYNPEGRPASTSALYDAGVPTSSIACQLSGFGQQASGVKSPLVLCPPCIMLTLPTYKLTPAKLHDRESRREFVRSLDPNDSIGERTLGVKRVLLVPTFSKPFNHGINPDLYHFHTPDGEIGITDVCNFGGKNDYINRGKIVPMGFAHNPHSCAAFCLPDDTEYLDSYWTQKDKDSGTYLSFTDTARYGWMEDIDVVLTRVGAMIAEHFFSTASGVSV
jgi:hypothetical protein